MHGKRYRLKPRPAAVLEYLRKIISESRQFATPLRLAKARSGARVCDPQRVGAFGNRKLLRAIAVIFVLIGVAFAADQEQKARSAGPKNQGNLAETEVRGRIVCLPEAMHELYHTDLPANHEHLYGFKTADGTFYTLLRTKLAEALFVDEQVRKKELILRGHVLPKTQIFEMTSMNSVRNGVICDLYYYCDICAIKTLSPGPCMCCQGPVNLVEKPLR